jgi:hypothetical protein
MQHEALHLVQTEVKHARLTVIDPDHRMIGMLGHESFLLFGRISGAAQRRARAARTE